MPSTHPLVSVALITRNRSEELADKVANVLDQTYARTEVLIVENGSNPDLVEHNSDRFRSMERVHYSSVPKNLGVSGGRRRGLERVNGDYIAEIDDDAVFATRDARRRAGRRRGAPRSARSTRWWRARAELEVVSSGELTR